MQEIKPIVGVGAVVVYQNKVLLIKRARPPYQGQWAIPGGKVKTGETLQQAAEREIHEETGLTITAGKPVFTFDHIEHDNEGKVTCHYVVTDLEACYQSGEIKAQSDAAEARWFSYAELAESDNINSITLELLKEIKF